MPEKIERTDFKVRAKALVAQMTAEEKCSMMQYESPAIERLGIPAYTWWNEGLHGVARAGSATVFPQAIGMAASFDEELLRQVADAISTVARAKYNEFKKYGGTGHYEGLTYWSPNINIFRDPRWGRGQETYGEDPLLTGRMGTAFVRGLQGDGEYHKVDATLKHFAVHSGPEKLRHEFNAVASKKDMAETYLPAFEALVKDANCDVVVCVPAVNFAAVKEAAKGSKIKLGAENVHWAKSGAFTGELSADMLKACGVEYVIIGHSERRQYFGETDKTVNQRVLAAVEAGLKVIMCVGENKEEREAGYTDALVEYQTLIGLNGLTKEQVAKIIIAYEPVWAIGTGLTATDEQANETIGVIRAAVARKYGKGTANKVRIQYGGSMNPKNVKGLMAQPEIDGGLIGGASLKAPDFSQVVNYDK